MPGDLFYGDNLEVMRRHVASESVDLVYLDPPFNSDRTYNVIHKGSRAQEKAFADTWTWDDNAEVAFRELTDQVPPDVSVPRELTDMMLALRSFLGDHRDMLAYLSMMAIRLVEMRRVLRPTGSLYLHCDPTANVRVTHAEYGTLVSAARRSGKPTAQWARELLLAAAAQRGEKR